ncbi:MAG: hypothetical protein ACK4SQ_15970 [Allorhizobium sp.]
MVTQKQNLDRDDLKKQIIKILEEEIALSKPDDFAFFEMQINSIAGSIANLLITRHSTGEAHVEKPM